ncbi:hypothetical protein K438DRAFT_1771646 [Mycena galopus ATCC 62051]|nr:hypothetical protein K438DRAFT_1771646 [Mycena galopus ATCC 62051]
MWSRVAPALGGFSRWLSQTYCTSGVFVPHAQPREDLDKMFSDILELQVPLLPLECVFMVILQVTVDVFQSENNNQPHLTCHPYTTRTPYIRVAAKPVFAGEALIDSEELLPLRIGLKMSAQGDIST